MLDIDAAGPFGFTALHVACQKGDAWLAVVAKLLELGASTRARCAFGQTPLLVAIAAGNEAIVRYLVEAVDPRSGRRAVDLREVDQYGFSPVRTAVQYGRTDILAYFVDLIEPPDVDAPDAGSLGVSPLELAARRSDLRAVQLLLRGGARLSSLTLRDAHEVDREARRVAERLGNDPTANARVEETSAVLAELLSWAAGDAAVVAASSRPAAAPSTMSSFVGGGGTDRASEVTAVGSLEMNALALQSFHGVAASFRSPSSRFAPAAKTLAPGSPVVGTRGMFPGGDDFDAASVRGTARGRPGGTRMRDGGLLPSRIGFPAMTEMV